MKLMQTGNKPRRNIAPKFYVKDTTQSPYKLGRYVNRTTAYRQADAIGVGAFVYKMGTCTNPVHMGGMK